MSVWKRLERAKLGIGTPPPLHHTHTTPVPNKPWEVSVDVMRYEPTWLFLPDVTGRMLEIRLSCKLLQNKLKEKNISGWLYPSESFAVVVVLLLLLLLLKELHQQHKFFRMERVNSEASNSCYQVYVIDITTLARWIFNEHGQRFSPPPTPTPPPPHPHPSLSLSIITY